MEEQGQPGAGIASKSGPTDRAEVCLSTANQPQRRDGTSSMTENKGDDLVAPVALAWSQKIEIFDGGKSKRHILASSTSIRRDVN